MADCQWSNSPADTLITYALGSCIGVSIFDPAARVGGLLHFMLPDSAIDADRGVPNPFKYADTGIARLLEGAAQRGALTRRLIVRVAGGAQVVNDRGRFNIGLRNYQALRRMLGKCGLVLHGEAVGGTVSRNVRLDLATGKFWMREAGGPECEVVPPTAGRS
jgi:chemotaxis protein CheD